MCALAPKVLQECVQLYEKNVSKIRRYLYVQSMKEKTVEIRI